MAVYYLLLCINIIPSANVIPDWFPTRNVSAIYLLTLAVCLVLYYSHRVSPTGNLSAMMRALSWMALLMILLRGIKYSAFSEVGVLARHTWYLYYVPMLLLPLFFFSVSLLVSSREYGHLPRRWYWALALTVVLIVLVLTNDLHQQVFLFQPGFLGWDSDYSHGWLYYAIFVWQYALCLASILILIVKCRISSSKKNAWLILIPFAVNQFYLIILINFFSALPSEIEEAATIDGLDYFGILLRIVLPLSKPALTTIGLYTFVFFWNNWFYPLIYLKSSQYPVMLLLRNIVNGSASASEGTARNAALSIAVKSAVILVSSLPVLLIYPFFQKSFVRGMTLGAVKG